MFGIRGLKIKELSVTIVTCLELGVENKRNKKKKNCKNINILSYLEAILVFVPLNETKSVWQDTVTGGQTSGTVIFGSYFAQNKYII